MIDLATDESYNLRAFSDAAISRISYRTKTKNIVAIGDVERGLA